MTIDRFIRARDRIEASTREDRGVAHVLDEVVAALHDVTAFSRTAVMTVDPKTLLPTGGVVEGFSPDACTPFWDSELLTPGYNKFSALARSMDPVATLVDATDGDLGRAPVFSSLYEPLGVADELRAAFVVGTTCWGVATLLRGTDDGPFRDDEVEYVRRLSPLVGRALRAAAVRLDTDALGPAAVVLVDRSNRVEHATVEARALMDELRTSGVNEPGLPTILGALVTRARASRTSTNVATRMCGTTGRWLRVTAAPGEDDDGHVAIVLEPARAADVIPLILESLGLTEREADIVMLLARGLATKEIAAELALSPHTVRDHLKAIFDKTDVSSRGALVAKLFSQHLLDGFHQAVHRIS